MLERIVLIAALARHKPQAPGAVENMRSFGREFAIGGLGLVKASQHAQRIARVVDQPRVFGRDRPGGAEMLERRGVIAAPAGQQPQATVTVVKMRSERHEFAIRNFGLIEMISFAK